MEMEKILAVREYKTYAYVIFNLQDFFTQWFAQTAPKLLDQKAVDEHFVEEMCRLNSDLAFWEGMETGDSLNEYLVRYAVMYFDYDYAPKSFIEEYIRNFMNSRRDYHPPVTFQKATLEEAGTLFKETPDDLKKKVKLSLMALNIQIERLKLSHKESINHMENVLSKELIDAFKNIQLSFDYLQKAIVEELKKID